jgi:hypothetical protein
MCERGRDKSQKENKVRESGQHVQDAQSEFHEKGGDVRVLLVARGMGDERYESTKRDNKHSKSKSIIGEQISV